MSWKLSSDFQPGLIRSQLPIGKSSSLSSVFTLCTWSTSDIPWSWSMGIVHWIPDNFSAQAYKRVLVLGTVPG